MMNRQFYEFWGNYFTSVAQGQKQLEDMAAWMKQGVGDTDDITALFRRCYGLDAADSDDSAPAFKNWQKAMTDFQQTFNEFAEQWGWVTQSEHQQALDKCVALEEKIAQQQATITQLRDLLNQEGRGHAELFEVFKDTFQEQSDQFNALIKNISAIGKDKPQA